MSRYFVALAVAAGLAGSVSASASAATFDGRCVGSGLIRTGAPLTVAPAVTSIAFTSSGACTGVLDGRQIRNAGYVGLSVAQSALLSCLGGSASGDTTLSIRTARGHWTTLHLRFDDANVLGTSGFTLRGAGGGLGWGQHQLTPDASMAAACLGAGIDEFGNTVSLAAITPLVG